MSDYTKKAEEFLIEQGYPNKPIKTMHKLGGSYTIDLAYVLTQYANYLEGLSLMQTIEEEQENINETLRNAGTIC
jgi:hypothetical protein